MKHLMTECGSAEEPVECQSCAWTVPRSALPAHHSLEGCTIIVIELVQIVDHELNTLTLNPRVWTVSEDCKLGNQWISRMKRRTLLRRVTTQ